MTPLWQSLLQLPGCSGAVACPLDFITEVMSGASERGVAPACLVTLFSLIPDTRFYRCKCQGWWGRTLNPKT